MDTNVKINKKKAPSANKKTTVEHDQSLVIKKAEDVLREIEEFAGSISKRAYELFEDRGRQPGREMEDWLNAEAELLRKPDIEVTESGKNIVVNAKVKDFSKDELDVAIEPDRVAICGVKNRKSRRKNGATTSRTTYSEFLSQVVSLPVPVKTDRAKANLRKGILHIEAPKA